MNFAYIREDQVVQIVSADSIEELVPLDRQYSNIVELTDVFPEPQVGWLFRGNRFSNPEDPSTDIDVDMRITKLAMLQRFTTQERLAILTYVQQNPVSVPAILLQNIQVTTFVDLNRTDTKNGVSYLSFLNIITPERVSEILTTRPSEVEKFKG